MADEAERDYRRTRDALCMNPLDFGPPIGDAAETDPLGHRTRRFMLRVLDMAREFPYEGEPRRWRISSDMTMRCQEDHLHHPRFLLDIRCYVDEHLPPNSIVLDPWQGQSSRVVLDKNGHPVPDGMLPVGR